MESMKTILIRLGLTLLGILGGFLYWKFIGCNSGSCPLTSTWYTSSIFGGVIGFLLSDGLKKKKTQPIN